MAADAAPITRFGMAPRVAGMSFAAFQEHWRSTHGSVVAPLPGLRSYVQHHAVLRDGRPVLPWPGFDACSQMRFDSLEAMDAAFTSALAATQIREDERLFVDKSRFTWVATRPSLRRPEDPPTGTVKLLTLWRPVEGVDGDALERVVREAADGADRPERVAHELYTRIPGAHEARTPGAAHLVQVEHFASVDDALAGLASPAADDAAREIAGTGQAVARHLATEVRVVG